MPMIHFRMTISCTDFRYRKDWIDVWAPSVEGAKQQVPAGWKFVSILEVACH